MKVINDHTVTMLELSLACKQGISNLPNNPFSLFILIFSFLITVLIIIIKKKIRKKKCIFHLKVKSMNIFYIYIIFRTY